MTRTEMHQLLDYSLQESSKNAEAFGVTDPTEKLSMFLDKFDLEMRKKFKECEKNQNQDKQPKVSA